MIWYSFMIFRIFHAIINFIEQLVCTGTYKKNLYIIILFKSLTQKYLLFLSLVSE